MCEFYFTVNLSHIKHSVPFVKEIFHFPPGFVFLYS